MLTLPEIAGKYAVGATTFVVPVKTKEQESRIVGNAKLKPSSGGPPGAPALILEEVVFTAFYPADTSASSLDSSTPWIPRPVGDTIQGYAHYAKFNNRISNFLLSNVVHHIKVPVHPNAHLFHPTNRKDAPGEPWPFVIFSHGLAGTRMNYSHFCARLAAQGKVVLAIEHRDGSGPFVYSPSPASGPECEEGRGGKLYLHPEDVYRDNEESRKFPLREDQLLFRCLEINIAFTHFKELVQPRPEIIDPLKLNLGGMRTVDGPWTTSLQGRVKDRAFWLSWKGESGISVVQLERNVCLAGHSFGGATLFSMLTKTQPELEDNQFIKIPVTHAVILDPWVDPLPSPGPAPLAVQLSTDQSCPPRLLVINSESFTIWEEHFERLKKIVEIWKEPSSQLEGHEKPFNGTETKKTSEDAHLITLIRAQHISFSDFGIAIPFGKMRRDSLTLFNVISDLVNAFLESPERFQEAVEQQVKQDGSTETVPGKKGQTKTRLVGDVGHIIVH